MEEEACPVECPSPPSQNASQCSNLNTIFGNILWCTLLNLSRHKEQQKTIHWLHLKLAATDVLCWALTLLCFVCLFQTYSPSSQASQQESDTEGYLWGSGLDHQNHRLPHKYLCLTTCYHEHLSWRSVLLTLAFSFSSSTAEADCSCGASHSLGQQRRDECGHPVGPGPPPQPGPQGSGLHLHRATSFQSTWYVKSTHTHKRFLFYRINGKQRYIYLLFFLNTKIDVFHDSKPGSVVLLSEVN